MFLKSFQIAAAAALIAAPALAHADEAGAQFTHEGVTYTYTTANAKGERVIRGTAFNGKAPFELHVRGRYVTGTFNSQPVEFTQAEAKAAGILIASN
jgi:hypothetical protein